MELLSSINRLADRKAIFFLLLFVVSLCFRFPTLFNDFYDVDELSAIVQTYEYMAGDVPGRDFQESKLPLYHLIFKFSYNISYEKGWVIVHFINIIIVFFTAVFIYLAGNRLYNFKTGAVAAVLYAVLISSFNRHFMATNGEVVFNLPLAGGLYLFIVFLGEKGIKKIFALVSSLLMGIAAAGIKFHGIIFFIFLAVFTVFYYPYYKGKFTLKYMAILTGFSMLCLLLLVADYNLNDYVASGIFKDAASKIYYAVVKGTDPFYFLYRFIHRQGMLALWHMIIWVPAFIYMYGFIKNRLRSETIEESSAVLFFILTYLMIFGGVARLYFHYFMAPYPAMAILAAIAINNYQGGKIEFFRRRFAVLLLVPGLFFLAWNTKDIIIKHFYPAAFYNEGKFLYWTRAVLAGSFDDYLLPHRSFAGACKYIEEITEPGDRIFVWGDGPSLYYFSGRRMGSSTLWPKTGIIRITDLYKEGDTEAAERKEKGYIEVMEKKKPLLFIDTSENGLSTFYYRVTPLVEKYINEKYEFIKEVDKMKIYRLKTRGRRG